VVAAVGLSLLLVPLLLPIEIGTWIERTTFSGVSEEGVVSEPYWSFVVPWKCVLVIRGVELRLVDVYLSMSAIVPQRCEGTTRGSSPRKGTTTTASWLDFGSTTLDVLVICYGLVESAAKNMPTNLP
jgi:hypothetical protein